MKQMTETTEFLTIEQKRDYLKRIGDWLEDPKSMADLVADIVEKGNLAPQGPEIAYQNRADRATAYASLCKQLGPRYQGCTFHNFQFDKNAKSGPEAKKATALDLVCSWGICLDDNLKRGGGVTLYGNPGTGKDHLMAALMYYAILKFGYEVKWVNGLDLYAKMRQTIQDDESEDRLIREFQRPTILCISDPLPPKGDISRYNAETLYRIIDWRYRQLKSTWATMNVHGGEEASDRMAQNLVDRLKDNSLCIHCDWESYRKAL